MDLQKNAKKDLAWSTANLLIYSLVMSVSVVIGGLVETFSYTLANGGSISEEQAYEIMTQSSGGYILAVVLGILIFSIFKEGKLWTEYVRHKERKMTLKTFLVLIAFLYFAQFSFNLVVNVFEFVLNQFGFSMLTAVEAASAGSTSWTMFLYAGFLGPISEELIFRGTILGAFKPYGKVYALFMSSALFGIFHGNPPQMIFAFLVGLLLGYVTLEYSIIWAIVLHIMNNFVIGDLSLWLLSFLTEDLANFISSGLNLGGSIFSIYILYRYRRAIKSYLQEHKAEAGVYKISLRSVWFWIFVVFMLWQGLNLITRI